MELEFIRVWARSSMRSANVFIWALLAVLCLGGLWSYHHDWGLGALCILVVCGLGRLAHWFRERRLPPGEPISKLPPLSRDDLRVAQSKLKNRRN